MISLVKRPSDSRNALPISRYRTYKNFDMDSYVSDVNYIPVSVCQVFDDPSDNYWLLQTMVREIIDDHAPLKSMKVRAREALFKGYRKDPFWVRWLLTFS